MSCYGRPASSETFAAGQLRQHGPLTRGEVEVGDLSPARFAEYGAAIRQGVNGFLAETPNDWYHHLKLLITNTRLRTTIAEAARQHVLASYGPLALARATEDVYRQIRTLSKSRVHKA